MGNLMVDFKAKSFNLIRDAQMASAGVSFLKNNEITGKYIETIGKLGKDFQKEGYIPNINSIMAFVARERPSDNLSSAVWQIGDQLRAEMEIQLGLGIMNGDSPATISRRIRKYLNNPTALFRKIKDKDGRLVPGIKERMYHPGRGVYKSAYKNAMRLTRTETTQAYLLADHFRWLNEPFVIGVRISLSGAHPAYPFPEICEVLAGDYPKWFIWVGWHPHCLCNAVPIMIPRDDFRAMLRGEKPMSAQMIDVMPEKFTKWVEYNRGRIEKAKSPPYFILDNYKNGQVASGLIRPGIPAPVIPPPAPKVAQTFEQIAQQALNNATTVQECNDAARIMLGAEVFEHKITNVQILKEAYTRLSQLRDQFKWGSGTPVKIRYIGNETRKNIWASANAQTFNMSKQYWNDPVAFAKSVAESVETAFHGVGCTTIKSVIDHEFGHVLTATPIWITKPQYIGGAAESMKEFGSAIRSLSRSYHLSLNGIQKNINKIIASEKAVIDAGWEGHEISALMPSKKLKYSLDQYKVTYGMPNYFEVDIEQSALSATAKAKIKELCRQFDATRISRYTNKNLDEFAAEGFTSAINNPGGNVYATKIMELIKDMQKKYGQ